jgi:hypothetical protein
MLCSRMKSCPPGISPPRLREPVGQEVSAEEDGRGTLGEDRPEWGAKVLVKRDIHGVEKRPRARGFKGRLYVHAETP